MKRLKQATAILLAITILLPTFTTAAQVRAAQAAFQTVHTEEGSYVLTDEAGQETVVDEAWEEDYPYGLFALGHNQVTVAEGGDTITLTVFRLGGTQGKASAIIQYLPAVVNVSEEAQSTDYAISADDITLELEDAWPITEYQPWGAPPAPEAANTGLLSQPGKDGEGNDCLLLSPHISGTPTAYAWEVFSDGDWMEIELGESSELPVSSEDLNTYDFRCVYTIDGVRYCTDSYKGTAYEKPAEVTPPEIPEGLELNPEPTFTEIDLNGQEGPYGGWLLEVCFAEGETEKDIRITAVDDDLPELAEMGTFTITDHFGGDIHEAMNTASLRVEDNDEDKDAPSQIGFTVSEAVFDKSDGTATLTVRREGGTVLPMTVEWRILAGSAQPGVDYADASGQLQFYGVQTEQTITIDLINDQLADDTYKDFTVELSELKGDAGNGSQITADACTVQLYNSNTGEELNLASSLTAVDAVDVSAEVTETDPASVSASVITGTQVPREEAQPQEPAADVPMLMSYDYSSGVDFTNKGTWGNTFTEKLSISSDGDSPNTHSKTIDNMWALYKSFDATITGGADFASGWDRLWHGQDEYAYTYFSWSPYFKSNGYEDCSPEYSEDGIHIYLDYYSKYYVDDTHDYSTDTGTITVGVKKNGTECSEDDIDSAAEVKFTRRTFDKGFGLTLHTANDDNTAGSTDTGSAAEFSEADYQNIIQSVTVTNGGLNGGKLYVGSTVDVILGDTHLTPTAAYITDPDGNRVFTGTVQSGSTGSTATFGNIILDPAKKYTFHLVLDRQQAVNIDLSTSAVVDAAGNYPDGALDDAYALLCSRASGLTLGYTPKDSTGNFPTSDVSLSETTVSYTNRELIGNCLNITGIDNIQYLNFNLPSTDAIVFNGKLYDGDEDIWLDRADIKTNDLHFYFYAQEYQNMERPMQATLDATALYLDANGNGQLDGYFDTASGSFVLTAVDQVTDQFVCYLEGDFEESMYAPFVDENGKVVYQYFLRPYYTANPVALEAPDKASEDDMMQVLPAIITDVTDPTAYAALTTQQKQYRYIISGISQIGANGTLAHTSDNHAKYGPEASAYSYVDMPLGGATSVSLPVTSSAENGTRVNENGETQNDGKYIAYDGLVYEYLKGAPENMGKAVYTWTPSYSGNLLYPFAQPESIIIPESAAGTNFPVTEQVTTIPNPDNQNVNLQVGTGTGITALNNYLGSFGSNDTFSLLVREQTQTTNQILSAQGNLTGTAGSTGDADEGLKETITRGNVGSYPASEALAVADGSAIPSDKVISDDKIEYKEGGLDVQPAIGMPANIANIANVTVSGYEVGFSVGIPVSGTINRQNRQTNEEGERVWNTVDAYKWSIGTNTRYAHNRFKDFFEAKRAGQGGQWATLYGQELAANNLYSRMWTYSARLSVGFTWKYDAMENQYLFSEGAVTLAGGISWRLSYRFTCFPIAYVYVSPGLEASGSVGLQVDRLSTTNESLLKGNKLTLKETGNTITYAPLTETGKPDTDALSHLNQISFVTNHKMLKLEFDGSLYIECYYWDNGTVGSAPKGFSAGFLRSQGKKPVSVTLARSDNQYIDDSNSDRQVIVYLTALTYDKGDDAVEDTTISSIQEVTGMKTDYSFSGLEIKVGGTLDAAAGVGIELLKLELYFKGNVTIGFAFARGAGGEKFDAATFDSFLTNLSIGFRATILWLNFGMDLFHYSIGYSALKDLNGQDWKEIDSSGWYHSWSAFNGAITDGDLDPLPGVQSAGDLKAAAADMGITITLPSEARAQAYGNGVNNRESLAPQVKAFDSNAEDFQVSGYGSSVNAFKLLDGTQTGHDYQIVTAGDKNYVLYTGTSGTGETTIDNTQLWLSLLEETDDVYGLVNPIARKGDAETPYITLDNDNTGDLDFYAWADGPVIHAVWVSFASETAAAHVDDDALQNTLAESAHNTVVKYASFDTTDVDAAGFTAPIVVSNTSAPNVSAHYFQPHVAGKPAEGTTPGTYALVYAQSIPYEPEDKAARLAQYETYLDTVLTADPAADPDGVLDATKSYRLNYQQAMLSVYGSSSQLSVVIPQGNGSPITGTTAIDSDEIITSLEMTEAGGVYYLAYTTQQDTFEMVSGKPVDLISTHRLYLRTLTVSGENVTWGEPYLLRTLVNYEENGKDADGAVKEGIYSGSSLTAPYTDPYFANLKFLTGKIGDGLSGQDENFSIASLLGGSEPTEETFLLFEMNGDTYIIRENSLQSITTSGKGQIIPFFTAENFYAAEGYTPTETAKARDEGLSLNSGKSEVVIGADGDGNLAAVYTSSVANTVNNAIYLSYWDATTASWSNGVILAMNYLDVYETSVAEGWDAKTTEAAYFSQEQGGGMTQFLFSNLQIALGRSQAQIEATITQGSGTTAGEITEDAKLKIDEQLYKNPTVLSELKKVLQKHGVTAADITQWLNDDPANRTIDPALREKIANSLEAYRLKQQIETEQPSLDTGDTAAAPELLILTQGALQQLAHYQYTDLNGETQLTQAPLCNDDGTMVPAQLGIYAISYGKGQQQVGEAAIDFMDYDYSAGTELQGAVSFRNVGDAAIRGSKDNPITVRLMLYDDGIKTELAQWEIKSNIGSSQTVRLTTDNRCAPLPADLGYGDYFYLTVEEDEAYVTASGGTAYLYDSATDPSCAYKLPVAHRPELSVENLTGKVHSVNKDGSVNIQVDFDVANRGSRRAKDTFVQFAYLSGLDENGEPIYTPLDITNNTLKVSQQQAIVQAAAIGDSPLKNGVLQLSTSGSYYSDDYYLTPEEYNTRRSAFYSTTSVPGWDSARYQGSTYWYNPVYATLAEAYNKAQAALSMWNYDDEADMYYKDGYSSYKAAKEASDAARKQEYILTAAQYSSLPADEQAGWHESDKDGYYIPIAFKTYEGAELVWKLACRDSGQNIFSHFYRNVRGTITVHPSQFKGVETGSLDLRVGVYSAGSDAAYENGLYISDHSDEYHAANNYSHVQLEHTGFIYAMPKVVLNPNTLNLLPVSIRTTTGSQPRITAVEVPEEGGTPNLSTLYYTTNGTSAPYNVSVGSLAVIPDASGSGTIHIMDEATNTTYAITYTIDAAEAGETEEDAINVGTDNPGLIFSKPTTEQEQPWQFVTAASPGAAVPEWPVTNYTLYKDDVAVGQPGATFTFWTTASQLDFYLLGNVTVKSSKFTKEAVSITGAEDSYCKSVSFDNPTGESHLVTVTVTVNGTGASLDKIVPSYGGGSTEPSEDPNLPDLYWSREFPADGSLDSDDTVSLTVYAVDKEGLANLYRNGNPIPAGQITKTDDGLWSYTFTVDKNTDIVTIKAEDTTGYTASHTLVTDNWYGGTAGDTKAPGSLTFNAVKTNSTTELNDDNGYPLKEVYLLGDETATLTATGDYAGNELTYYRYDTKTATFVELTSPEIKENGYYMVEAASADGSPGLARRILWIDAFEQAPTLTVTTTPITDPVDQRVTGYTVTWKANKDPASTYSLQSVTVNGAELLTATSLYEATGSFTIPYGGNYTFEVTDSRGIPGAFDLAPDKEGAQKSLNLTVPVYLPDKAVTYEHAWGQPVGDKPASNGSFTIDFGQVTGGYYDQTKTTKDGKALMPEDYSGSYQYVVLHPDGELAGSLIPDGENPPTPEQLKEWKEKILNDWKDKLTWTAISTDSDRYTIDNLYAGKNVVLIRDTSNPATTPKEADAAIEITYAELMDAAIDVVSLSARLVADANATNGEVYATAAQGHTGQYEFAILPKTGDTELTLADFQADTVTWQRADWDGAGGANVTFSGLGVGTYQVAVRARYADSDAYAANSLYWSGVAISKPVEVKVGTGSSIEAVPSRASSSSAANGFVTVSGKSSGTEPVYFQYAILPLESEEAARDFSADMSDIADLNLTWYFADDLSDPEQTAKLSGLTAGWYQVFARVVYDDNELTSPTLTAQLNALAQSEDPTTANSNQDLRMAAQNAYDKAPGNYLTAAYTTVHVAVKPSSSGTTSTITVPISGDENTILVEASVTGDTAVIDHVDLSALNTVIGEDVDTGVVTIDFSGLDKALTTVVLPAETIKEIADAVTDPANDAESLEIIFTDGTSIEFDAEALREKSAQADGLDITITIQHAEDAVLTDAQREAIGDRIAYDITVTSGGEPIADLGGRVTIHAPYHPHPGETPYGITVYYVDEEGGKEACHTSYDGRKKRVNWKTNHLSVYMIDYDPAFLTGCPRDHTCPIFPFTDADPNAWYHDGVHFCVEESLMNGVADTAFAPNGTTSRAMIVTILHRLEGTPAPAGSQGFDDVPAGTWYTEAVRWAAENGIVNGYGNGAFGPNDPITREQMAAIFWRYAKFHDLDVSQGADTDLSAYTDAAHVSGYAIEPLRWACGVGLIQGMESADGAGMILDPQGDATRAQAATIIMRLCTGIL